MIASAARTLRLCIMAFSNHCHPPRIRTAMNRAARGGDEVPVRAPRCWPVNRPRWGIVLRSPPPVHNRPVPTGRSARRAVSAGSSHGGRLYQAGVIMLDVADARAHRPASHLFRWVGREYGRELARIGRLLPEPGGPCLRARTTGIRL